MKTLLYISPSLELRHSEKGWPEKPGLYFTYYTVNGKTAETGQRAAEIYSEALAKAKQESIKILGIYPESITHRQWRPDEFIEFDGEVEIGWQYYVNNVWRDCVGDPVNYMDDYTLRKVAWLKPVNAEELNTQVKVWGEGFHINKIKPTSSAHSFTEAHSIESVVYNPGDILNTGERFDISVHNGKIILSVPHGSPYHLKNVSNEPIELMNHGEPVTIAPFETKMFNEGLKARILDTFRNHWKDSNVTNTVVGMLSEVLDELGIK